jgi:hypothetical protein
MQLPVGTRFAEIYQEQVGRLLTQEFLQIIRLDQQR